MSGDAAGLIPIFARTFADPVDDLVVGRLADGDAFDHAGVDVDVGRAPGQAVGVEEACREQERGALVGVGERRVVGEVCEQDGRLLGQRWVGLDVAE